MMTAAEIMTKEVITISGAATVAEAVELMKNKGLRALIVKPRSTSDPYGMVTETDIIYKVAAFGHDPKQMRVYEIMTKPCIIVNPDLGVEYVARLFGQTRIRRAPVIKNGELVGVVSVSDILRKSDFVEKPKPIFLEDQVEAARHEAYRICTAQGNESRACAVAWETVEELQATAADLRSSERFYDV